MVEKGPTFYFISTAYTKLSFDILCTLSLNSEKDIYKFNMYEKQERVTNNVWMTKYVKFSCIDIYTIGI